MTPLKTLLDPNKSHRANAKALGLHWEQLRRWLDNDAHFDAEGNVYIRTKADVKHLANLDDGSQEVRVKLTGDER